VVLIDGLRPDAVTASLMPHLSRLGTEYARAESAVTVRPSVTVAALASLATGVSPATHGLVEPGLGFLTRMGRIRPLARELAAAGHATLVVAGPLALRTRPAAQALAAFAGVTRLVAMPAEPRHIAATLLDELVRFTHGLAFVYLPDCDRAGHAHGWLTPPYLDAVRSVDQAVGILAPLAAESLLVVTSDHGGGGVESRDHDLPHPVNDRIPLVLAGPRVRRGFALPGPISLLDIPPSLLAWLGVPVPGGYEGRVLAEALVTPGARVAVA
jgi:predicted AlkP superfamily pyrophosphatase or phosphodiesterase